MAIIENAAVFVNRRKRYVSVRVEVTDTEVVVYHRNGTWLNAFPLVEVAQAGKAWDVTYQGKLSRVVAEQGCGCGGVPRVTLDAAYSGALPVKA